MRPLFALLPFLMEPANDPATPGAPPSTGGAKVEEKPTIGARLAAATAALTGKDNAIAAVQAELAQAGADLTAARAQITDLTSRLDASVAENTALKAQLAEVESTVADLEAAEKDLAARAAAQSREQVAALGFPSNKLPAASAEVSDQTDEEKIAALNKKIEASADPLEKGRLAQQAWDLMTKGQGKN